MLTFEPADAGDLEAVYRLNKDLIDTYEDMTSIEYSRVLNWVHRNLERTISSFTRIFYNGELAGYYCLIPSEGKLELDSFFVFPDFQGKGIGTAVLQKCLDEAELTVFLYVFRTNIRALALYQRMGFQIAREVGTSRYIMEYQKQGC